MQDMEQEFGLPILDRLIGPTLNLSEIEMLRGTTEWFFFKFNKSTLIKVVQIMYLLLPIENLPIAQGFFSKIFEILVEK